MTNPDSRSVKPIGGLLVSATLVACWAARPVDAQTVATAAASVFEAATVQVSAKGQYPTSFGNDLRGNRYEFRNATMVDLINAAYGVPTDKIVGGPSWLEADRFDVAAQAPVDTSRDVLNRMLQSLLADRFKLVVRNDSRPQPALTLALVDGASKLKEANPAGKSGCPLQRSTNPTEAPFVTATCRNMTMEAFVRQLTTMAGRDYIPSPVTDLTGLKGAWDFDLKWTSRTSLERAGSAAITFDVALEKQVGLTLKPATIPVSVLAVDQVERKPTSASSLIPSLPSSPPPAFEVAVVKPSSPETRGKNQLLFRSNGRADIQGVTLKRLIQVAWRETTNDWLTGGPAFLDSARYDIAAKFPDGYQDIDQEAGDLFEPMLQALLADRFKVAVHQEDHEVSVYTLSATKTRLRSADPAGRTNCKTSPAPLTTNLASGAMRMTTCTNITMAEFADRLQRIIGTGYVDTPVLDATGLAGSFDFNLIYSPASALRIAPAANGADPAAADPNGAISFHDALSRLGLKLEKQKHKMPVLVVDHAEETPTDN